MRILRTQRGPVEVPRSSRNRLSSRDYSALGATFCFLFLFALILTGCATPSPVGRGYCIWHGYSVVNNTGVDVDLVQDGQMLVTGLRTGQVQPVGSLLFRRRSVMTAIGHDGTGTYVGSASWIFCSDTEAEVWEIRHLNRPEPVWPER